MADSTESPAKRPRLGNGFMGAARRSFRNLASFFGSQSSGIERRAKKHEGLPTFRPDGRIVPRYVRMDPIKDHPARMEVFERVMKKIEAAVSRSNIDLRCNSAECVTDPSAVNEGRPFTILLRYGRVATHGRGEPFLLDLEGIWSVSQFDADPDLDTVLVPFSFQPSPNGPDELEFRLVFHGTQPYGA
jgi:hypothetical protein